MAKLISVMEQVGGQPVATFKSAFNVKSGTAASIKAGYLVITDTGNAGYVKAAPDDTDTDDLVVGVANSDSSETVSADGTVTVEAAPTLFVKIKAKTPGSLTSALKLTDKYTLNVSSGDYTLDQSTTTKGIFRLISFDNTTDGNCEATVQCTLY